MKKVTNLKMLPIYGLHKELANAPVPFKFTIAKNLKVLEDAFQNYKTKQQELHSSHVLVDGEGNAVIKPALLEAASKLQNIPYQFFEYKDEESEKSFFEELTKLNNEEISLDLVQESLERKVRFKLKEANKEEEYITISLQEYLDEFSESVSATQISELLNHEILI